MLKPCQTKTTCDNHNCKQIASHCFDIKGKTKQLNLCGNCLLALREDICAYFAPKSPTNAILKTLKRHNTTSIKEDGVL